jgi:PAS domain S-box-containing protein
MNNLSTVALCDMDMLFLEGGGEMGQLIREKDWTKNSLGIPQLWPQSLKTTLSIILNSRVPHFLFWGPDLICFYNDPFRPSLGNEGKHPSILGAQGKDGWSDIWDIIKPWIDNVLNNRQAIWLEDQLVPFYRNGKIEDIYWTFCYSPVKDESGKPAGVFVTCNETTGSVLAYKKAEASERKLSLIISEAPVAISIFRGPDYSVEIVNAKALELWDRKQEDVINKPILEVMSELEGQGIKGLLDNVYKTGTPFSAIALPVNILRKGKLESAYVNFNYEPLYDASGNIDGLMTVGMEVTEQVLARKKIEENEKRLHVIIAGSELGDWELNLKTKEVRYSDRYLEIMGHKPKHDLTHYELYRQIHADDIIIRETAFEEAILTGTLNLSIRIILNDQSLRWVHIRGKVFYDELNNPDRIIGTLRDITEEKNQQQILQESERRFRLLADSMPQHVWTSDVQGNLNYFNQSVFDYSGLTPDQINKDGWIQIVHPDDRDENVKQWVHSVSTGKDFLFEHRFRRYDGVYRWQLSRAIPQRDASGNITMWVGTSTDIEEHKTFANELEMQVIDRIKELKQKNEALEQMNLELQSFAYVSSHDLQEPLRKIQTIASLLLEKEGQNLTEDGRDYFNRLYQSASRMQILIQDLLAYSRTNIAERVFEKVDLKKIVLDVQNDFNELLAEKRGIIEIGEMCEAGIIPFQFRQLMHNLISNSLKFSKSKGLLQIKIKSEIVKGDELNVAKLLPDQKYCHISVSDNGIGFDPQYKDRIFEVFQRLHGREDYKGTGIGLAIVKKIVENHHGIITAAGDLDKGATFDIYIPVS